MARRPKLQNVPLITMDVTKGVAGEWHLCAVAQHSVNPPGLASLFVRIACLPDERHITRHRSASGIVDKNRVCAGYLDVHLVGGVDVHDVASRCATVSTGDVRGRTAVRFQAGPLECGAGDMYQTHLTYRLDTASGAAAPDQHPSVGG